MTLALEHLPEGAEQIFDIQGEVEAFGRVMLPYRMLGFQKGWEQSKVRTKIGDVFTDALKRVIRLKTYEHAAIAVNTTKEELQTLLGQATEEGWGIQKLGQAIRESFDVSERYRSLRIARTELTGTINEGSSQTLTREGFAEKEWSTVIDGQERDTHHAANGQVVGIHEMFKVGGELARFPGDENLSPSLTINCRCVLLGAGLTDDRRASLNRAFLQTHGRLEISFVVQLRRSFLAQRDRILSVFPPPEMPPAPEAMQYATEKIRGVDTANRRVTVIISTNDLDGNGNIIDQSGWDFDTFKTNPVILLGHDDSGYTGSNGLPIVRGIPASIRTENQKTFMDIEFPQPGVFPLADTVFNLVKDGFMNAVSVGWKRLKWEMSEEQDESGNTQTVYKNEKQLLLEVSFVSIPANDGALVQRAKQLNREGDVEKYRKMAQDVEEMMAKAIAARDTGGKVEEKAAATVTVRISDTEVFGQIQGRVAEMEQDYDKFKAYFERKQPANRESTKVLKAFFDARKEKQPDDEIAAWKRMAALLDETVALTPEEKKAIKEEVTAPAPEAKPAEETPEVPAAPVAEAKPEEEKPAEAPAVEQKPEEKPAEAAPPPEATPQTPPAPVEEPPPPPTTIPPTPAEEAPPAPERKASVRVTISALKALPRAALDASREIVAEALRSGTPVKDVGAILDALAPKLKASLVSH